MENRVGIIWAEVEKPGIITLHFDETKTGYQVDLRPDQARRVTEDLSVLIASFDTFDNQTEG